MLPSNFLPGASDPLPSGIFLVPLCTDAESVREMTYALDTAYKMTGKIKVIKDFINALQFINNPGDAICMSDDPPVDPVVTIEADGDCQRVLIDGVAVTDWICPPDPEQQPPPEPTVGTLGFTVTELEQIAMGCLNLEGSIKWVGGVLYIRTCDGWLPVPGGAGAVLQTGGSSALAQGMLNFDEWVAAGEPEIAPSSALPHNNAAYETFDSLKCAKATALVDEIWNVLTIGEAVRDANTISQVITAVTSLAGFVLDDIGYALAQAIWSFATGSGFGDYADEMEAVFLDEAGKNDLICNLVPLMTTPVRIGNWTMAMVTADDVKVAIERFEVLLAPPDSVKKTIRAFPVKSWIQVVAPKVPSTDCACEQYLPFGYVPPLDLGEFRIDFEGFANIALGSSVPAYVNGVDVPPMTSPVGTGTGVSPKTVYHETLTGGYHNKLAAVYRPSEPFQLGLVRISVAFPQGEPTVDFHWTAKAYRADNNTWVDVQTAVSDTPPIATEFSSAGVAIPDVTTIVLTARARNNTSDGTPRHAQFSNIRFDGNFNGQGFIGLAPGQTFTP